jgi:hypothetical protein
MGGGFTQNLNMEVTPARIEKEVAMQIKKSNQHIISDLDLSHHMQQSNESPGFTISKATMNLKEPLKFEPLGDT